MKLRKKWAHASRIVTIEPAPTPGVRRMPEHMLPIKGTEMIDPVTGKVTVVPLRWEAD